MPLEPSEWKRDLPMTGTTVLRRRRLARALHAIGLCTVIVSVVAACTSSAGKRAPSTPPPSRPPATLSTSVPDLPATPPTTPAALVAFMTAGLAATGFVHLTFDTSLAGTSLSGTGSAVVAGAKVTGLDVRDALSGIGAVRFVLTDGVAYVALPTPTKAGKPFAVIGGSAHDDRLNRAAIGLQATQLLAAPGTYRTLVSAATNLTLAGRETIAGRPALHYRAPVQVDRMADADPVRIALTALAVPSVALDVWVDGAGRPLKASAPSPDGRTSHVTFDQINAPVRIARPPADQVDGAG
jgi:hypothetical protein